MVSDCLCGWVYLGSLKMDGCVNAGADVGQPETLIRASYGLLARRALAWGWGVDGGAIRHCCSTVANFVFRLPLAVNKVRQSETAYRCTNPFSGYLCLQANHLATNRRRSIA